MTESNNGDPENVKSGDVLGPDDKRNDSSVGDNYIALISQYTERPDLLIETLERHDPGFVRRMNEKAEARSDKMNNARFLFGGFQAYSGLAVSIIAAITMLGLVSYMVIAGQASFWIIIALIAFYAVSQGGPSGFLELCRGIADLFRRHTKKDD